MKKIIIILALFAGKASAQIQVDKISHLAVGGCIGGFSYCLGNNLGLSKKNNIAIGVGLSFATAVAKEVRDRKLYSSPINESIKDISYTTLGAGLACLTLSFTF
jgi:hypothetical protein